MLRVVLRLGEEFGLGVIDRQDLAPGGGLEEGFVVAQAQVSLEPDNGSGGHAPEEPTGEPSDLTGVPGWILPGAAGPPA